MSVVGIDLGTLKTVIAAAKNRGVDIITNEVSNRSTPSMVGFGPKSRYIGEAAKTQEISNLQNTISSLKRLCGRSAKDPDVLVEQQYITAPLVDINGQAGVEVSYLGSKQKFTAVQLVAMLLGKIRQTAAAELKLPVSDMVMSVPAWFTDAQRRSLLDSAEIAGLKALRLINDNTAAALSYGITKTDLPEDKPRRVAFVDVGHSTYTCSIVEFRKGVMDVKATAWDHHFGGRNFDQAVVEHLAKEFKLKYKLDIYSNGRAAARVQTAAEKIKRVLSANQQAPIHIESLMNDVDVAAMMTRPEFETLVEPLLRRAHQPLKQALADAGMTVEDIDVVEVLGGGSRVPILKERIQEFFGKTLSFTLNQDEAVARGCAFSCAILSPVFKVRDFAIHDMINYPVEFSWEKAPDIPDEDTSLVVFNKGNIVPSTKILTFYRKQSFDLEARYANPDEIPGNSSPWIGRFFVKAAKAAEKGEFIVCKLKARINIHGILNVESGYYVEEQEIEEEIKEEDKKEDDGEKKETDVMDTDAAITDEPPRKTRKVKKQIRKGDLPIVHATTSLEESAKQDFLGKESQMTVEDKLVADTEEKKNELETYIYDLRSKLDDQYADLATDEEKQRVREKLDESETWLYDEGEDATKAVYIAKIEEIQAIAGPISQRHFEKVEAERQTLQAKLDAEAAARKAEEDSKRGAAADAQAGESVKAAEQPPAMEPAAAGASADEEMSDLHAVSKTEADGMT